VNSAMRVCRSAAPSNGHGRVASCGARKVDRWPSNSLPGAGVRGANTAAPYSKWGSTSALYAMENCADDSPLAPCGSALTRSAA
jgi:hypothetical protein